MKHRLFVYGTLQSGQGNHRVLVNGGATFIGIAVTKPEFTLRAAYPGGGYPYLCPDGETEIHGEVYEVDDAGLALCDRLEGYPHHYDRREIELAYFAPEGDGPISQEMKALVYIPAASGLARMSDEQNPRIASGDWKAWVADARADVEIGDEDEDELEEDPDEDEDEDPDGELADEDEEGSP